jgi:colanic acid/amylovoran biosynthesis glycosyltransferase
VKITGRATVTTARQLKVGYVVHTYPSVSHTFVQREVLGLRAAGASVSTFSVHRARPGDALSAADQAEAARTTAILPITPHALIWAHLRALLSSPVAYVKTLCYSIAVSPPGLRAHLWQLFYFAEAVLLRRRCRHLDVRHLHAHLANVATDLAWLATELARRDGHCPDHRWSFTMHGPTEFNAVDRYNLARKVQAADLVICISDFCRSQLMALVTDEHWAKLVVVHCGSDLDRYRPAAGRRNAAAVPHSKSACSALQVLCVGRLVPEKGQAVLLQAIAALRDQGLDVEATLVGGGPDRQHLIALASRYGIDQAVTFTGPLGQDDVPAHVGAADVVCLPSFSEGLPVVLMEAMAAGVPVVATRITGIPELVQDGVTGLVVPPGRVDALARALRRLAFDEPLRTRLGDAGRRKVEREFNAADTAADLHRHFARLQDTRTLDPSVGSDDEAAVLATAERQFRRRDLLAPVLALDSGPGICERASNGH